MSPADSAREEVRAEEPIIDSNLPRSGGAPLARPDWHPAGRGSSSDNRSQIPCRFSRAQLAILAGKGKAWRTPALAPIQPFEPLGNPEVTGFAWRSLRRQSGGHGPLGRRQGPPKPKDERQDCKIGLRGAFRPLGGHQGRAVRSPWRDGRRHRAASQLPAGRDRVRGHCHRDLEDRELR